MLKNQFIKKKLLLTTMIITLNGCGLIIYPFIYPFTKPQYINPNYEITTECAEDIIRSLIIDSGNQITSTQIFNMVYISMSIRAGTTFGITNSNGENFEYYFSKSGKKLKLVLYKYSRSDLNNNINMMNSLTGISSHSLPNCLCD